MREENSELQVHFRLLIALTFVSVDDVTLTFAFDQLRDVAEEELLPIFDSTEDNSIRGRRRGRGGQQSLFPPNIWNCYDLNEITKNNKQLLMGKTHPSLRHLLALLQRERERRQKSVLK
ncbi:hypothetical protein ANN_27316 [Periplaneta americana]|uniref:Uncharacterized protein n=1 Tax=Periplaneta americana TaxID=6978 RepID=A0ABQ8RXX9_PERAM|nr:hypothetical protein ANN_27316 [Periplaneta americana]